MSLLKCWFWTYGNSRLLTAYTQMRLAKPSTHRHYLNTEWWKILSGSAKRHAGNACQLCNSRKRPLHTHHRSYGRKGTFDEYVDLIVLCEKCHTKFHKEIKNGRRRKTKR